MKSLIVLAFVISVLGCSPRSESLPNNNKPTQNNEQKLSQTKGTIPAALVFEGGKGSWISKEGEKRTPYWRLHVCLSATDRAKEGSVQLNLKELGTPYRRHTIEENPSVYRLNDVIIHYSYTAEFINYSEKLWYGKALVKSESQQTWQHIRGNELPKRDLEIFSPELTESTVASSQTVGYTEEDGTEMYMSYYYSKAVPDQPMIEACEKTKEQPYVLEILKK